MCWLNAYNFAQPPPPPPVPPPRPRNGPQMLYRPERMHGSTRVSDTPSLRDVAHDGFSVHLVIDQPKTGTTSGVVRQGWRHGPSIMYKITPCWVTLLQPARRAAVLDQPSSLQPQWYRPGEGGGKRGINFSKNFLLVIARQCRINP